MHEVQGITVSVQIGDTLMKKLSKEERQIKKDRKRLAAFQAIADDLFGTVSGQVSPKEFKEAIEWREKIVLKTLDLHFLLTQAIPRTFSHQLDRWYSPAPHPSGNTGRKEYRLWESQSPD